jgi:uncharacterized BrkB/YihY/UPF0761 family membrane protein
VNLLERRLRRLDAYQQRHGSVGFVLGVVLGSHSGLRKDVIHSALSQFPIAGNDLATNIRAIHRNSVVGLTVGLVGLVWGSIGLAENGTFTMEQVWNIPGPDRPNYPRRLLRALAFLTVIGTGTIVSTFFGAAVPAILGALSIGPFRSSSRSSSTAPCTCSPSGC